MSEAEVASFLDEQRVVICATNGRRGWPHLMPLWYVPDGGAVLAWTYASSQKAKNLERDPQATLQIETGDSYDQLRGVMMECEVELVRELEEVRATGLAIMCRYAPGDLAPADAPPELIAMVEKQAPKRVVMRFSPTRVVSWDHRKLGGTY